MFFLNLEIPSFGELVFFGFGIPEMGEVANGAVSHFLYCVGGIKKNYMGGKSYIGKIYFKLRKISWGQLLKSKKNLICQKNNIYLANQTGSPDLPK